MRRVIKKLMSISTSQAVEQTSSKSHPSDNSERNTEEQIQVVKNHRQQMHVGASLNWEKPKALQDELPTVPEFQPELLPNVMSEVVMSEARRMDNAPADYVAVSNLVCLASIIGNTVGIKPKRNDSGWIVYPTLWGMIVGSPSMKKTPTMEIAMKFLSRCQTAYLDPLNREKAEQAEIHNKVTEQTKEDLQKKAKQAFNEGDIELADKLAREISQLEVKSGSPRSLIINDATIEAIIIRLVDNPNGILFFRDELSGWFAELKKKGREHERAIYLQAFNASKTPYIVERVGRENITVPSLTLSILGGIQPEKLKGLLAEKRSGDGDDGLSERFQLIVYPDSNQCCYVDESPNEEAISALYAVFLKLVTLAEKDSTICEFDEEAQIVWNNWSTKHSESLKHESSEWQAARGKHPALLAKLALIFHLVEEAEKCEGTAFSFSKVVRKHHLERGMDWMSYLELHLQKVMMLGTQEIAQNTAHALLKNLSKLKGAFTKQQLAQKGWRGLKTPEEREKAISTLVACGYIREVAKPNKHFVIHPDFC
ncbi:hypothetical protein A1OS_18000 [Enterovibrio norvegicus]|uniref:DUF3987 domain-containing protein n=1 Tax=Enterovibrio norvegicus TaxID=188144 RepID=UPI0002F22139|nr:DUF3987 domain-containing protein [Enterovibrio norvegicus]OEE62672.1 hypothetical protein A1OS_18000 [Enterovibrio norvegicus]